MDHNIILIRSESSIRPFKEIFEGFFPEGRVDFPSPRTTFIVQPFSESPPNPEDLYHLLLSDIEENLTFLSLPGVAQTLFGDDFLINGLAQIKHGHYEYEAFLLALIKAGKSYQDTLRRSIGSALESTHIHNALALAHHNMNISLAAKALYVHRNTLNYRIESIREKTGINIRQFNGLMIFHLLFS